MSASKSNRTKQTLDSAVRYFEKCKCKVVVRGNLELQLSLETIKAAADQGGLEPTHIIILLDAACSGYFAQIVSRQLIRCLIPKRKVPQESVIKAISWMSTNNPPIAIQSLLLRWILVVYDYIDGNDKLHSLYGILFLFLDSQVMLPHVCHLLFLLTRKEDVKMFRVRKILSLIQGRAGPQPCLIGLLTIYKLYYPNLTSFSLPNSNKMFFGSYDRKWKGQVREIVEKAAIEAQRAKEESCSLTEPSELRLSRSRQQLANRPPPKKKQRLEYPISHSASADLEFKEKTKKFSVSVDKGRLPFVRIDSFVNLLQHVDRIEFPSQVAACLKDAVLQHLMAYAADRVVTARFNFWLQHALTEEFLSHKPENSQDNERFLKLLVEFTDFLQEGIPVVDNFLAAYLQTWNGVDYAPLIFRLIARCQLYPFTDLNELILQPLHQLFCTSSVYFKCQCLLTLTELLKNYAAYEAARLKALTAPVTPQDHTAVAAQSSSSLCTLFPERLNETVQPQSVIENLAAYLNRLASLALQLEGDNHLLLFVIVTFIQLLSMLTKFPGAEQIILPSPHLIRYIMFSSSVSSISKVAEAFCSYKDAFSAQTNRRKEMIAAFNDMLVDFCDILWRNKAFANPAQGSLRTMSFSVLLPLKVLNISQPGSRFSIFQGLAFLPYAWSFFVKTQPGGKSVHPNQLKSVKDVYLDFLLQEHLAGVVKFINTFIMRKSCGRIQTHSLPT